MNLFNIINKRAFVLLISVLSFGLLSAQSPMTFVHPGAISNKVDLDFVKTKIKAGEQPWIGTYEQVKEKARGGSNALTTINSKSKEAGISSVDAHKAYANALAWYFTDEEIYAKQAIEVLNAWSVLQSFNHGSEQDRLQAGYIGAIFGPAAEIMRGYSGWKSEDITKLQDMFRRAFYPQLKTASFWNGNVDLTQIDAMMNIAVFNDDETVFKMGIERLRKRTPSYFYLVSDSGVPPFYEGDNMQHFWSNPTLWIDGLTQETCRDNNHHAQFGMASALHAAEVAWNQGVDIYTEFTERYTAAMELMALQFLSGEMQGTCANNVTAKNIFDTWEVGYNHYHNRKGISLPNTEKLLKEKIRLRAWSANNIFYETLTHADLSIYTAGTNESNKEKNEILPSTKEAH